MKKLILVVLSSLTVSVGITAQDFEGILEFKKQEGAAVDNSVWYVRGDMVRIDEFEPNSRILKSCYLINNKAGTAQYVNHKAKTWENAIQTLQEERTGCTVEETDNTKEMFTYKTNEYTVKNANGTVQLSYWLNFGKFGFFRPALKWVAFDNVFYDYFWVLPAKDNMMPMLVVKTNEKGEETGRLEVTRIEKRTVDAKLFDIPAGYSEKK